MENKGSGKKPCIKCLLSELDSGKIYEDIKRVISLMKADEKVPDSIYMQRLGVCKECTYLNEGTCNACGCYVELRGASVSGKCPYGKW